MSKAEKFIKDYTRNCSNEIIIPTQDGCSYTKGYTSWLTPDHARRAVEIEREETINEVCEWLNNHYRDYMHNPTGKQLEAFFGMDMIEDLKKHFENKL